MGSSLKLGSRDLGAVSEEPKEDFQVNRDPGVGDSEDEDQEMENLFKRVSSQRKSQQTPQPSPAPPKPQRHLPNNSGGEEVVGSVSKRFSDSRDEDNTASFEEKLKRFKREREEFQLEKELFEREREEFEAE